MDVKKETTFISADQQTPIHVKYWMTIGQPKAVVQIIHGMLEHVERYENFALFLNQQGFAVVGHDQLGHGDSYLEEEARGDFGKKNGLSALLKDIHTVNKLTSKQFPATPLFMLGHSMGSFLLRNYLIQYAPNIQGAIIMGTGWKNSRLMGAAKKISAIFASSKKPFMRSKMLDELIFSGYNKKIKMLRTDKDWLTTDEAEVDKYLNDPKNSFTFTVAGYQVLFEAIKGACATKKFPEMNQQTPLYLVSGKQDPVGDYGKGVLRTVHELRKMVDNPITFSIYEVARHELLNEQDKQIVYTDLLHWMRKQIN